MPYLSLVHLREVRCLECGAELAQPGARSIVVDLAGDPIDFPTDDQPAEMSVELTCINGHQTTLLVPNEVGAEETLITPDDAPLAGDAMVVDGTTESGKPLVEPAP
jgi:hypothetical protein